MSISAHRIVQFFYDGGLRTVEPYCHGVSTAGNEVLRGYQIGGFSRSENPVGWRLFDTAKMDNFEVTEQVFEPNRPEYNPDDPQMLSMHCCI